MTSVNTHPRDHSLRGTRIPDEAKLWFQDFHAYQARVHGKSLAYNIRRAKQLVPELFGPVSPDTFRRWHDGGAPDHRGRPPVELPPFALSRLANLTHAVAARLSLSVPTWQHVYRRVLRELDIEFEPTRHWTRQFLRSLQLSWKLAAICTRHRPSEADIARERKLLQLHVIYLCDRFGISQDRIWNLDETAVRIVPTGERGWTKRAEAAHVFASRAFVTVTLAANMRGGMWTQIVYEGKSDREHIHGPAFPCQLVSHSPTHWITQDALLDMIDAIDADMHARPGDAELTPWLLVLDCPPQHIAAEFRSIMRNTRPHIKLCYVQRNFTGRTCAPSRTRSVKRWPITSPSSSWKLSPTSNMSIWTPAPQCSDSCCSHSCTQPHRAQTARNIEPLAGASSIGTRWSSVSFSQKQNVFWRQENCFHEAQPRSLTRQLPTPKPATASQRRT